MTDPLTRSRHDSNRLLKAQGAANALAAAFGALPSAASAHTRVAAYLVGARTPAVALFHALFMLSAMFVLAPLIAVIPVSALAGIIIYIALTLVDRWTRDLLRRLGNDGGDKTEILLNIAVVCGVTLSLLMFNIIVAFGIGIAAAVVLLLVRLSGSPVRRALDGSIRSSLKVRSPEERAMLLPKSRLIRILELEGTLFFGTTDRLQTLVESLPEETRFVILDFRMVTDIDASGARSLETMGHMAARRGMRILFSHVREQDAHGRYLRALGIDAVVGSAHWFADLDRALEWAEDALLDRERFEDAPEIDPRDMALFSGLDAAEMTTVCALLERREFADREVIFNEGDEDDSVYLIARGSVSIKIQLGDDTRARRLATLMPGVFFGEMAMIEGQRRSADAFANGEQVVLYALPGRALSDLMQRYPQLALKIYRNLSRELAARLRSTSSALRALE
ncbi:MAG: cyclic nucleotide-binding domain-containing protein [Burkholderiales bacterium]